jgi:hypothetical protein
MRGVVAFGALFIPIAWGFMGTTTHEAHAQCRPGYNCGPATRSYPGPRQQQVMPRQLPRPVMQYNPAMRSAFPQARLHGQGYVFSDRSRAAAYAYQNSLRQQSATYGSIDRQLRNAQVAARVAPWLVPGGTTGVSAFEGRVLRFYAGQAGSGAGYAGSDVYGRIVRNPGWLKDFDPSGAQSRFPHRSAP